MIQDNFFKQSYNDALSDYLFACTNSKTDRWDWVVLTAANERQASAYRIQIEMRKKQGRLPKSTNFIVITDYEEMRIGSGGATLNVIKDLTERVGGIANLLEDKILVIHSGGDSKRIPQYSACGKLFAPVPRMLPNGFVSTIFDELLIAATDIPNRCGYGMMIFPSDTELLFNSLQLDLISCDAAGLSMKAPAAVGQDHGVFVQGENFSDHRNHDVAWFMHKQSVQVLNLYGAVDSSNQVDVDTGCIWLSSRLVKELFGLISVDGLFDQVSFDRFVNPKVCLNFYSDFVYPLAENSTADEFYKETPENGFSDELRECRRTIFERLHKYRLSLVKLVPARYIHFGMTHEMNELFINDIKKYSFLGWERRLLTNATSGTVINSYIVDSSVPDSTYVEDSIIKNCIVGENSILSNLDIAGITLPENVVLHGLKLNNGKYVCRIYGRYDNPKASSEAAFLGGTVSKLLNNSGLSAQNVWGRTTPSIWNARIYPECDSMQDAVRAALGVYEIISGTASDSVITSWKNSIRYSLNSSYNEANVSDLLKWQSFISNKVMIENFVNSLAVGKNMTEAIDELTIDELTVVNYILEISEIADTSLFPQNMRLYLACADLCKKFGVDNDEHSYAKYEDLAYEMVCKTIINETFKRFSVDFSSLYFIKDSVTVELPIRVNFCGSPSDAAPYCLEHGGTMIDGALLLRGKKPIKVTVKRIPEKVVRFESFDQGCTDTFYDIAEVSDCANPFDTYALHKAVLVASGVVPLDVSNLTMEKFCSQIGGGIEMVTDVDVPKGSGLGTSSIIAAAAIKAVNELFGIEATDEMIYAQVFLVEQLMTTGGGWQDQVGAFNPGIKYFTAQPGTYQKINVDVLDVPEETIKELNERFAFIFSGQRRLARNVLREEMNQTIRNNPSSLDAIRKIQEYCAIMRYYLLKGDITSFAKYITAQFEMVKVLDKGASNTCIEYIFDVCDDLIDGKSICGAGGGGFLQVILKKGVTKEDLKKRIQENFLDCGVEVWESQFI